MPTYETGFCDSCHIRLGKNEMKPIKRTVSPLRSGASFGVRQNGRRRGGLLWSWNSGRKYYTEKTVWLCEECYRRHERTEAIKGGLVLLAILVFIGIAYFGSGSQPSASQQTSPAASVTPDVQNPASLTSSGTAGPTLDQTQLATSSSAALPSQVIGNSAAADTATPASALAGATVDAGALIAGSGAISASNLGGAINTQATNAPQVGAGSNVGPSIEKRGAIQYPIEALRSGEEGEVELDVAVGVSGDVENVTVVKSSGYRPLDIAAVQSVRRWRFSPGRRNGQPVDSDVRVPVKFSLSGMQ